MFQKLLRIVISLHGLLLIFILALSVGCNNPNEDEILVFSAASTTNVIQQLGDNFSKQHGINVKFNFGGSTSLSSQIIRGAPADILITSGDQPMDELERRDLLEPGSRVGLLTNSLALISPLTSIEALDLKTFLIQSSRIAIANPSLAPAGIYTQEALKNMGLWDTVLPKLVYGSNIRTSLGYVASGNVDSGVVYNTDAQIATRKVRIIDIFPTHIHSPIIYPGAILKDSVQKQEAKVFLTFLQSEAALEIFRNHGFEPVR